MRKEKPYLTKKQIESIKKYCNSDKFKKWLKKTQDRWENEDAKKLQDEIEWWIKIKDEPYTI